MRKISKSKWFRIITCMMCIAVLCLGGGILAFLSDADTATNTFTVGKISIDLQEPNWDENNAIELTPNKEVAKDPKILNDGNNPAFVFLEVKVPYGNIVTSNRETGAKLEATDTEFWSYDLNNNWVEVGAATKDTEAGYITHVYAYGSLDNCTELAPNDTTNSLFDYVRFTNVIEEQGLEEASKDIIINAYGIQTKNLWDGKGVLDGNNEDGRVSAEEVWGILTDSLKVNFSVTNNTAPDANGIVLVNNSVFKGEDLTISVHPNADYVFKSLKINHNGSVETITSLTDSQYVLSNVQSDVIVEAEFINQYSVTKEVNGNGSITLSSGKVVKGNDLEITATPDAHNKLVSLEITHNGTTEDVFNSMTDNKYVLNNVQSDVEISATFAEIKWSVTTNAGKHGTITKGSVVKDGDNFTITVTPDENYTVATFTVNGVNKKNELSDNIYLLNSIQKDVTVEVTFELAKWTVTTNAGEHGTITRTTEVNSGSDLEITVTPDFGYKVSTFTVNGVNKKNELVNNVYTLSNIQRDTTIDVTFELVTYIITTNTDGHGTITEGTELTHGSDFEITVTPNKGYQLACLNITHNGTTQNVKDAVQNNTYTINNIQGDVTIESTFELIPIIWTIDTVSNDENMGTVTANPEEVNNGDSATITVTPNNGYHVKTFNVNTDDNITVDSLTNNKSGGTYTISEVLSDTAVNVEFEEHNYTDGECIVCHNKLNGYATFSDGITLTWDDLIAGKDASSYGYSSVTQNSVGKMAFKKCRNLVSIKFPSSVLRIYPYAFQDCSNLQTVTFEENSQLKSFEANSFYQCSKLTDIRIPSSVTGIYDRAFYGCSSLQTVIFEENSSLTLIDLYAFYNCYKLSNIEIPASVKVIGERAFQLCKNLKTITFGENSQLTTIGASALSSCYELTDITIPASVTKIDNYAFRSSSKLETIIFEENSQLTTIGDGAFYDCNISNIKIPDSTTSIGAKAFADCDSLIGLIIPDNVTSIGDSLFYECDNLTYLHIGAGITDVTPINWTGFLNIISLQAITVSPENTVYKALDGVLFNIEGTTLIWYPEGKTDGSYTIPNTVKEIGANAFYSNLNLINLEIPSGVTNIGTAAFYGCENLNKVNIPNVITQIGERAFYGCKSLTSIIIPEGIQNIENYTFYGCTSLLEITIPASVNTINEYALSYCSKLSTIQFNETLEKWNTITFGSNWDSNTGDYVVHCTDSNLCKSHTYGEIIITKESTCTETGIGEKTCSVCGYVNTVIIPAQHKFVGNVCSICGSQADGKSFESAIPATIGTYTATIASDNYVHSNKKIAIYKFVAPETKTYVFKGTGTSSSPGDTYAYLFNSSKSQIKYDDDSAGSSQFKISYACKAGETYYLGVAFYSSSKTGDIPFSISE